jgi:hypothetical protein
MGCLNEIMQKAKELVEELNRKWKKCEQEK